MIIDDIKIEIIRKQIKNLYLRITPSTGEVKVSSPKNISEEYIKNFVVSKISWIKKQQKKIKKRKRENLIRYETGEKVSFDGNIFELVIIQNTGRSKVIIEDGMLKIFVNDESDKENIKRVLEGHFRKHLKKMIPLYIAKWEPVMGVRVNFSNVKKMKTKWGTCNTQRGRIWLNLELAKKDRSLLEYVVVHEMVHLLERNHSKRFYGFMDEFMPKWKELRKQLNGEVD
jgi:predicted metal-dependent hydrolase